MRVVLEAAVFQRTSSIDLLPLLWMGITARHHVVVDDHPAFLEWLGTLEDEDLREGWREAIDHGFSLEGSEPSYHEIQIAARKDSAWGAPVPILTVTDAIDLLQRPYRVLVENGISDRAFLLCLCSPNERSWLEERIEREWVEIEHCGGNDHLEKRVTTVRKHPSTRMRCSALFDGDGLRPGEPSKKSRKIKALCEPDVHHHQLERRAIENYLPRPALEQWCKLAQGKAREHRAAQVEALFTLSDGQRAHYNMKEGFKKDEPNAHKAGDLFGNISAEARRLLHEGLDDDIAKLYRDGRVRFHELERVSSVTKVQAFAREILERIR